MVLSRKTRYWLTIWNQAKS